MITDYITVPYSDWQQLDIGKTDKFWVNVWIIVKITDTRNTLDDNLINNLPMWASLFNKNILKCKNSYEFTFQTPQSLHC